MSEMDLDDVVARRNRQIMQDREVIEQARAYGFEPDPRRAYEGYTDAMQAREFLSNPQYGKTFGSITPVGNTGSLLPPSSVPTEPNLLSQGMVSLGRALQSMGVGVDNPERTSEYPAWGVYATPEGSTPSAPLTDIGQRWLDIASITQPSTAPVATSNQPTQSGSASPAGSSGSASAVSSSVQPVSQKLGVPAESRVLRNATTNYGGSPVRIDSNGIYNVPDGSLGALESYAAFRGTTATALAQQEDALKARGMQESEYWQDQYAQALAQTGNPNLARAHANLAATQASDNAYGVFDRAMAEQTMNASALGNNQINGQLYLDRNAGAVNQGLLSTAPQAYGANGSGGTLIRLPSGQVVSANMNANTPAMISATSLGADAAYNQDLNYTQAMAKLDQMKAQLAGINSKNNPNDPLYQLNQQMKIMQIQKAQQALSRGEMPKLGSIPWDALPPEVQELQIQQLLGGYDGIMDENQGRVE